MSLLISACNPDNLVKTDERLIKEIGQKDAIALKSGLLGQIQPAMKSGGPMAALTMYKGAGPALTSDASDNMPSITIRRISARIRNPKNAPYVTAL